MITQTYTGLKNKVYKPGSKIGQGGEGAVFELSGEPTLVIKIYTETLDAGKAEKLLYMATLTDPELLKYAAWPLDIVSDKNHSVCGFIMKKLSAFVPLHNLFNPMDRKKLFPDKGYNFLVHVARNVAIAFYKMHQMGIIIGDVNEANILVNPTGIVSLIDCDSFQIREADHYYFCEVGIPRYTPPELLEQGTFTNVVRTENTDHFSLATLLFQLLFLGRAPFTGINPTHVDIDEETAIRTREFAYSLRKPVKKLFPAKNSLELKSLSPGLIRFFHAAFEDFGTRPTAFQWISELELFGKDLVHCSMARIHYYPKGLNHCPWCAFREKANILYFLDDAYLRAIPDLNNIDQFVNGFKMEWLEVKRLSEKYNKPDLKANRIPKQFYRLRNIDWYVIAAIVLGNVLFCLSFHWGYILFAPLIIFIFKLLSPAKWKLKEELERRQKDYEALKQSMRKVVDRNNYPPEMNKYNQAVTKMSNLIADFKTLPVAYAERKKTIEEKHYNLKFAVYLRQFDIMDHPIAGFGQAKKQLIYTNGIQNAGDIFKLKSQRIAGIGPKNIQILFDWQRQIGADFTYMPDINAINNDMAAANTELSHKRQKLETDIKAAYNYFNALKGTILANAKAMEQQHDELSIKLAQAELDVAAFSKLII